jgi:hypothetical protein
LQSPAPVHRSPTRPPSGVGGSVTDGVSLGAVAGVGVAGGVWVGATTGVGEGDVIACGVGVVVTAGCLSVFGAVGV